jgi:Domain of unknown function (DUF1876)
MARFEQHKITVAGSEQGMIASKRWRVEIQIDEHEGKTRASAWLYILDEPGLGGVGLARLNPADSDVPQIGDELAVARALSDLGHQLLDAAAGDIEQITHQPAHLSR